MTAMLTGAVQVTMGEPLMMNYDILSLYHVNILSGTEWYSEMVASQWSSDQSWALTGPQWTHWPPVVAQVCSTIVATTVVTHRTPGSTNHQPTVLYILASQWITSICIQWETFKKCSSFCKEGKYWTIYLKCCWNHGNQKVGQRWQNQVTNSGPNDDI